MVAAAAAAAAAHVSIQKAYNTDRDDDVSFKI